MENICKDFDEEIPVPGSDADCEESEAEKEYWMEKIDEICKLLDERFGFDNPQEHAEKDRK